MCTVYRKVSVQGKGTWEHTMCICLDHLTDDTLEAVIDHYKHAKFAL